MPSDLDFVREVKKKYCEGKKLTDEEMVKLFELAEDFADLVDPSTVVTYSDAQTLHD